MHFNDSPLLAYMHMGHLKHNTQLVMEDLLIELFLEIWQIKQIEQIKQAKVHWTVFSACSEEKKYSSINCKE